MSAAASGKGHHRVAAFFDLDHTLINTSSGLLYYLYLWRRGDVGFFDIARASWWMVLHKLNWLDVETLVHREMRRYAGTKEEPVRTGSRPWFDEYVRHRVYGEAHKVIADHRAQGHFCALLSAATPYVCEPMRDHLDLDATLCTRPIVQDGQFTGEFEPPYCYGEGKIVWAERLAGEHGFDLDTAYFYSDSYSDLPMLERVGNPRIVNPDPKLRTHAEQRDWPILRWSTLTQATVAQ